MKRKEYKSEPEKDVDTGGNIVSMDPEIGELPKGDVLIEGGKISAVGPELEASGADIVDASERIVMPGFVDAHRHLWQGAIKHTAPNTNLGDYFGNVLTRLAPAYRPEDVYAGNLIGAFEALDAGVTTLLDWSHIQTHPRSY